MEGELYNLWPSDGLVNQLRSNYRFSAPASGEKVGDCNFWVDKKARKVTPDDDAKGIVARATLFMSDHYQIPLSKSQRRLMVAWHKMYPPSVWEKEWARNVAEIEGYKNSYIGG
jgi:deoxyribonuclease-1